MWSRLQPFDPKQPFKDFTPTLFRDLVAGLASQIDQGKPVLVDTSLYTGHSVVIEGYDKDRKLLTIADPFIAAPGLREISFHAFRSIWNSPKAGSAIRGAVFTRSP